MERLTQLKFLLVMAASDGGLAPEELRMLSDRAKDWGVDLDEFEQIVTEATGDEIELDIPTSREDRILLLTDVIRMMGADGVLHEKEKELFALMATKLEFTNEEVNQLIDEATRG